MTVEEKAKMGELRRAGMGYLKISQTLGINQNTVKTFCRRNNLAGNPSEVPVQDYGSVLPVPTSASQMATCFPVSPRYMSWLSFI